MKYTSIVLLSVAAIVGLAELFGGVCAGEREDEFRIIVRDKVLHPVDARMFGHFMERASWGERGYDAARNPERPHQLRPKVVEMMDWMNIPLIRWPAGGDLIRIDWTDMIDNAPGREGDRPVFKKRKGAPDYTNAFGLDEFLGLCEKLDAEPLLPVRFHPALMGAMPPKKAAREAAALVAYCNVKVGAELPEKMADWPSIRKQNGREKPWNVKYFQIGNETWHYFNQALKKHDLDGADASKKADFYLRNLRVFLKAIHRIDPSVKIIVDGVTGAGRWTDQAIITDPTVQKHASYFALHLYQPWGMRKVQRDGKRVPLDKLSAEQIWYNWVSVPAINPATGQSRLPGWPDWWLVRDKNLPIAVTEWNWNGWWKLGKDAPEPPLRSPWARGVGAAGMLHAFMRSGNDVRLACQSMLVGESWGITSIRVGNDDENGAHFMPTGRITGFYSRHHGSERFLVERLGTPTYAQPLRINAIAPAPRVATVDVVATGDEGTVFLHLINRHFSREISVRVDLDDLGYAGTPAVHHCMTGKRKGAETNLSKNTIDPEDGSTELVADLPAASVSIIEIPRPNDP